MELIRDYKYKNIQRKFVLLYSLNVSDILFTLMLLQTGLFKEVNGAMIEITKNPMLSIFLKVVVIGVLVFIICKRMRKATEKQLKISNVIISGAVAIYGIINLLHISYLFLYIGI